MTEQIEQTAESVLDESKGLIIASRFADAEKILEIATTRFPKRHDLHAEFARVASYQAHWKVAIERWDAFRVLFPHIIGGYSEFAAALRNGGRSSEALDCVGPIVAQHPERFDLLSEHARCLGATGKTSEALDAWAGIRRQFPERYHGFLEAASLLRRLKRLPECASMLQEGLLKFPETPSLLAEEAILAETNGDKAQALVLWRRVNIISPNSRAALFGIAKSALESASPEEAIPVLTALLSSTPSHLEGLVMLAKAQTACGDLVDAKRTLENAGAQHPGNKTTPKLLFEVRMKMIAQGLSAEDKTPNSENISQKETHSRADVTPGEGLNGHSEGIQLTELMNQFESLGDNCEFGLVQRYFGSEPLGLLRWSAVNADELTRALKDKFFGVGEAENTTLIVGGNEYITRDRNYRMAMHTFQHVDSIRPEILLPQLLRRLKFLKRRLMEDLAEGVKIFVYKAMQGLSGNEIEALFKTISNYGNNRLLCVQECHGDQPSGHIDVVSPNLAIGYVRRFGLHNEVWNIDFESWLDVCTNAQLFLNRRLPQLPLHARPNNANLVAAGNVGA